MIQRAGISLSRLAYDADYSITRVDYDLTRTPSFSPPTSHKLVDGHTVNDIMNIFDNIVGFDKTLGYNGFAVSIPIGSSNEQRRAFYDANHHHLNDHFHTWASRYSKGVPYFQGDVNLLFMDLTPGQVASKLVNGRTSGRSWYYNSPDRDPDICLNDLVSLNTQDVYEKLVKSIVPTETRLHRIGILRPEGAFPEVSLTDLEHKFMNVPVELVTLDELSHGAAIAMDQAPTSPIIDWCGFGEPESTSLPTGIILADDRAMMILPENEDLPARRKFTLTTSRDNQTTATIRLVRGNVPFDEISLEDLIPRPKGQAAINFTLDIDEDGATTVTMEEVGTDLKKEKSLGDIKHWDYSTIALHEAHQAYHKGESKQVGITVGENGIIGELPE
jgi:hypothetical protein